MKFIQEIQGKKYAANIECEGVFVMSNGAYRQERGISQTPTFRDEKHFRKYILKMLRESRRMGI